MLLTSYNCLITVCLCVWCCNYFSTSTCIEAFYCFVVVYSRIHSFFYIYFCTWYFVINNEGIYIFICFSAYPISQITINDRKYPPISTPRESQQFQVTLEKVTMRLAKLLCIYEWRKSLMHLSAVPKMNLHQFVLPSA